MPDKIIPTTDAGQAVAATNVAAFFDDNADPIPVAQNRFAAVIGLSDTSIGGISFRNAPTNLSQAEQKRVRDRILTRINQQSGNYTLLSTDVDKVVALTGSSAATFTLPTVSGDVAVGWSCWIANDSSASVTLTISGSGGVTIDGSSTEELGQGEAFFLQATGSTSWQIRAKSDIESAPAGLNQSQVDTRIMTLRPVAYSAAEKAKLAAIESGAQRNVGVEYTSAEKTKLATIEDNAKDDQTAAEVSVNTTNFNRNLGSGDNTVQKALDKLDDLVATGDGLNQAAVDARITTFLPWKDIHLEPNAIAGDTASLSQNFYLYIEDKRTTKNANRIRLDIAGTQAFLATNVGSPDQATLDRFSALNVTGTVFQFSLDRRFIDNLVTSFGTTYNQDIALTITFTDGTTYTENLGIIADSARFPNPSSSAPSQPRLAGDGLTLSGNTLSVTNQFTDADESKLDGIEAGAEENVQSDWDESDSNSDAYIQNKPVIPTVPARAGAFTAADETKLDGIAAGAEVNRTQEAIEDIVGGMAGTGLTYDDAAGMINATSSGGLSTVASDATITGTGATGSPLSVANPFTAADERKLDGIAAGAEVNPEHPNVAAWTSGLNPAVGDLVRHGSSNTVFMCIQAVPSGSRTSGPDGLPNNYLQLNTFIGDWQAAWYQPGSYCLRAISGEPGKRVYVAIEAIVRGDAAPESSNKWRRVDSENLNANAITAGTLPIARGGTGATTAAAARRALGAAGLSDATPKAAGTASAGTSSEAARADHVHPATTPTLANVSTALGLGAPAAANRLKFIQRKRDDAGFQYVDAPSGVTKTLIGTGNFTVAQGNRLYDTGWDMPAVVNDTDTFEVRLRAEQSGGRGFGYGNIQFFSGATWNTISNAPMADTQNPKRILAADFQQSILLRFVTLTFNTTLANPTIVDHENVIVFFKSGRRIWFALKDGRDDPMPLTIHRIAY